ncbi:MAG: RidA family protein [Bacilli bacterium]|jgi:2-iminobutanoate/2-iminopropanoate deaminase
MKIINSNKAPNALGPYSQGIYLENGFLFLSGQIAIDPKSNALVEKDITLQTKMVLKNIKEILNEACFSINDVVKTTIFLTDLNNFAFVNTLYQDFFENHKPARSCVEVSRLPKDALIEIEVIAYSSKKA